MITFKAPSIRFIVIFFLTVINFSLCSQTFGGGVDRRILGSQFSYEYLGPGANLNEFVYKISMDISFLGLITTPNLQVVPLGTNYSQPSEFAMYPLRIIGSDGSALNCYFTSINYSTNIGPNPAHYDCIGDVTTLTVAREVTLSGGVAYDFQCFCQGTQSRAYGATSDPRVENLFGIDNNVISNSTFGSLMIARIEDAAGMSSITNVTAPNGGSKPYSILCTDRTMSIQGTGSATGNQSIINYSFEPCLPFQWGPINGQLGQPFQLWHYYLLSSFQSIIPIPGASLLPSGGWELPANIPYGGYRAFVKLSSPHGYVTKNVNAFVKIPSTVIPSSLGSLNIYTSTSLPFLSPPNSANDFGSYEFNALTNTHTCSMVRCTSDVYTIDATKPFTLTNVSPNNYPVLSQSATNPNAWNIDFTSQRPTPVGSYKIRATQDCHCGPGQTLDYEVVLSEFSSSAFSNILDAHSNPIPNVTRRVSLCSSQRGRYRILLRDISSNPPTPIVFSGTLPGPYNPNSVASNSVWTYDNGIIKINIPPGSLPVGVYVLNVANYSGDLHDICTSPNANATYIFEITP